MINKVRILCLVCLAVALGQAPAAEKEKSFFKSLFDKTAAEPGTIQAVAQDQAILALKEALAKGVDKAVTRLNKEGGFLTNLNVKIEIPAKLATVEKGLRALEQGPLLDQFVTNMNRAAEIAVGQAGPIFGDAVKGMSIADADKILHGANDAATQYFRKVSEGRLREKMLPLIQEATAKAGATATYKSMLDKADLGFSFFKKFTKPFNLDDYVNQKAADGLFAMIAEEEKRIRENPAGQASDLLKQVFGKILEKKP